MRGSARFLLALCLVAAAVRLWGLGSKSLWTDEGVSWALAVEGAPTYEHPPLYQWLLGACGSVGSNSEWRLRFPSVVAGVALVPVVYLVGARLVRRREALIAAALSAVSPILVMVSQEARMYSLLSLAGAVSVLAFLELKRGPAGGWRLLWVVSAWSLVATHHVGWLLVLPQLAWLLFEGKPEARREALLLGAILLLLYAPVIPSTIHQVGARLQQQGGGMLRLGPSGVSRAAAVLYRMGSGYSVPKGAPWLAVAAVPLLLACLGAIRVARERTALVVLAVWLLPAVGFVAVEGSPANVAAQAAGAFFLLMGAGISRAGRARVALLLLLFVSWGGGLWSYYHLGGYPLHPEDWRSLARHLEAHCRPDDVIYLTGSRNSYFTFDYYYRGGEEFICRVPQERLFSMERRPGRRAPGVREAVETILAEHATVWVAYVDWGLPAIEQEIRALDRSYLDWEGSFGTGLRLKRYTTAP